MKKPTSKKQKLGDESIQFVEIELKKKAESIPAKTIKKPEDIYGLFENLQRSDREKMISIHLDAKSKIIAVEVVAVGNSTTMILQSKDILRTLILTGAKNFILVHNHPSGDPKPSAADKKLTKTMAKDGKHFDIPLTDHIIIGEGCFVSMAREDLI